MKILFVIPRNKSLFGDKGITAHPHIGIAYLSAFLKEHNCQVAVYDEAIENNPNRLYSLIDSFNPALIGITVFSYCYGFSYNLIKKIKAHTSIPLVAGGPHICAVGKKILEDANLQFAVKQEGEFTLLELLKELQKETPDFSHIRGLIWRNEKRESVENQNREFIDNLDDLPFPDYNIFKIKKYVCYKQRTIPLVTSRGCPFGCNYCSVRLSMGQRFRRRSAANVFSELVHLYRQGWRNFDINDDCFTLDKKRAEEICDLIIGHNLDIRFQLYNGIRVDTVDLDLLTKMKRAGCYFISFGCEAGNDKVLKAINKGITLSQVSDAVAWANQAGIPNSVNFIIGHKQESYQDALETIDFARRLPAGFVNFYNLIPYPGTESFAWASQHGHFLVPKESFLENISYRDNQPVFETKEFTRVEREYVVSLGLDLYRKKILVFRMGKIMGNIFYWITKQSALNKFATHFALNNPIGRAIYKGLSRKSFIIKKEVNQFGKS